MPGLFEDAQDFPLSHEIYVDQAFTGITLAGSHRRDTRGRV